jgi:hypothetical protein
MNISNIKKPSGTSEAHPVTLNIRTSHPKETSRPHAQITIGNQNLSRVEGGAPPIQFGSISGFSSGGLSPSRILSNVSPSEKEGDKSTMNVTMSKNLEERDPSQPPEVSECQSMTHVDTF